MAKKKKGELYADLLMCWWIERFFFLGVSIDEDIYIHNVEIENSIVNKIIKQSDWTFCKRKTIRISLVVELNCSTLSRAIAIHWELYFHWAKGTHQLPGFRWCLSIFYKNQTLIVQRLKWTRPSYRLALRLDHQNSINPSEKFWIWKYYKSCITIWLDPNWGKKGLEKWWAEGSKEGLALI